MTGKVYLVGAGPGDPELITLKALKLLKSADVVLHDDLISPEILAFIPSSTEVQNVGKRFGQKRISQAEINALMVQNALLGLQVVRLKSGDPLIFGRAGEEMEALRNAGIEFEIVPGVTAAFGAAANAKIPLTHRQVSSAIVLVTGRICRLAREDSHRRDRGRLYARLRLPQHGAAALARRCAGRDSMRHRLAGDVVQRAGTHDDGRGSPHIAATAFAYIAGRRRSGATGRALHATSAIRLAA